MTLVKFNNRNRLFPWNIAGLPSLSTDEFFNDDFFAEDSLMPAMNIKDKKNDFEIEFAAPGFNKKDFEVTIDDNVLHVSGEKSQEQVENEEDFTRKEFSFNSFKRSLKLPNTVNSKKDVKATYKNGILKLSLMKKEDAKQLAKKVIEIA
ncbi:Hsp20/alpha crystallin family protein [Yeosuana sp.]|uniref:Hsp20/alpha crystallin family protein n=1 Tax=Yeosuana sp. TaxID=2529388 RepID=UPI004054E3DF